MENLNGLQWALTNLQAHQTRYNTYREYLAGVPRHTFASDASLSKLGKQFSTYNENLCSVVVDVISDRLQISGFTPLGGKSPQIEARIAEIWRRNRMEKRAGEVHSESLGCGDAFVIVDKNPEGQVTLYPNRAGNVALRYDDENPGYVVQASKWWLVTDETGNSRVRLNLYYRDRTEKYLSSTTYSTLCTGFSPQNFQPIEGDWLVPNPYGKVPVFHFANNAPVGMLGRSELADVAPLNAFLNKVVADMMVNSEFVACPQRYATGLQIEFDGEGNPINPFESGPGKVWVAKSEEGGEVRFGQFEAANLTQYIEIQNSFREAIARVSGIPIHYFNLGTGGWPSGESLKTAEARLSSKVKDRQTAFGNLWADVMRFALEVEGFEGTELDTIWENTEPRNEATEIQNAVNKVNYLGVPASQVQRELGYSEKQVNEFEKKKQEDTQAAQKAFNSGLGASFDTLSSNG